MYCLKCDERREEGLKFCVNCGTPLVDYEVAFPPAPEPDQVPEPEPEPQPHQDAPAVSISESSSNAFVTDESTDDEPFENELDDNTISGTIDPSTGRKKPSSKALIAIIGAAAALVAIFVGVVVIKPGTPVKLYVKMAAATGGLFDADCVPTSDAKTLDIANITVAEYGKSRASGTKPTVKFEAYEDGCAAVADLALADHKDFEVYVGETNIGLLAAADVKAGTSVQSANFTVYRHITGTVALNESFGGCSTVVKVGIACTVPSAAYISADLHFNKMTCNGIASQSALHKGGAIQVTGEASGVTTKSTIGAGKASMAKPASGKLTCTFKFDIANVPYDAKSYQFKIGSNAKIVVPAADVEKNGGKVSIQIK